MSKLNLDKYNTIIFDFDGVILDSNNIKKDAINEAVNGVLGKKKAMEFVNYFISLNGIPREHKISKFVPKSQFQFVLKRYEKIIEKKLVMAKLIPGVKRFIMSIYELKKSMIILSGGTRGEVMKLISLKGLDSYFSGIYGGPKNKEENLLQINLQRPVLYFGDSEVDYFVSSKNQFDFVFVYGASNITNWQKKVSEWQILKAINNFNDQV